ncbi:arginine--tRNA ligase [Mesoterricola silvestris]|uniref:Arginine--tRNA ligase n=1 Tax=Mesoterricola silvestris TaxID=2927979 RepID=A0AA48GP68_9BACT|nr:arginine--tRNA ligase [Mesoterricola silvestris]BDU71610.1 arginine--tRNA ligase [Mesoterricola silvestris]
MEQVKKAFIEALAAALPGQEIILERPRSGEMGDLAYPCFKAAKALGKNPAQLAKDLAAELRLEGAGILAAGPYLNLRLEPATRARILLEALLGTRPYGSGDPNGEVVIVEYSSPNIAKLFTIGHLRSTMIGHAQAQVNRYLGCEVVRINHLGDWGTQFGTLLAAYKHWAEAENPALELDFPWADEIPEKLRSPLYRLFQLYVRFHGAEEEDPALREEARDWFRRLEEGDPEARRLWSWFREISLRTFNRIYQRLGVAFDHLEMGEAFYQDQLVPAMRRLEEAGLLVEGQNGARIVDLEDVGIATPCLVQKADGASIYATRDLAAAMYRKETFHFDRCIYVVGADQILHFQQIFAVMTKLDPWFQGRMVHTPFGMINLPEGKMSTRKGNVIFLEDVLDEAVARVTAIIDEKNPDLPAKAEVAEMLGLGAVVFFNALNDRVKSITFTWDRVIALDGDTGPYVQYAHARICSVLRKAGGDWADLARPVQAPTPDSAVVAYGAAPLPADLAGLADAPAQALLFELAGLPDALRTMARENMATALARQLLSVAKAFSGFYTNCPILWAENTAEVRDARLALCVATARALRQGLFLMGIQAPEEM